MKNKLILLIDEIIWILASIYVRLIKKDKKSDAILVLPAADLNGGFGEDVMIASLISNFGANRPITILTENVVRRDDYLGTNGNVTYTDGFKQLNYFALLEIIKNHSDLFVVGADIMDGTYGYHVTNSRIRLMKLAAKLGLTAKFTGFSVSKTVRPFAKTGLQEASKVAYIKARDEDSHQRLSQFISGDRLVLTNDIAFICPNIPASYQGAEYDRYMSWCQDTTATSNRIIAVCTNSIQARKITLDKYVKDTIHLLNTFAQNGNFAFVFLYHDLRPLCDEYSDKDISAMLFEHFTKNTQIPCYFPTNITNGVALKGYLKPVDFTITGRMHLGISGAYSKKPMFGVCYANKFEGMLKLFSIDPSLCLIDYTEMENCSPVVKAFLQNFKEIKSLLDTNLAHVQKETMKNGL